MKLRLTAAQSRYLALALLLGAIALLAAAIAWPVWHLHQHYDAAIDEYSDRLARYKRVAAMQPDIDAALAAIRKEDTGKFRLKATTNTLAAAELQNLVTKIIESNQGRVVSSQVLPGKEDGKASVLSKVTVSVQMASATVPLQLILHAIETAEPYLFVDQLTLRAQQGRAYKPVPGIQPELFVQLNISAYSAASGTKP